MAKQAPKKNWMSAGIALVLVGTGVVMGMHHNDIRRDLYLDQRDCERDWPRYPQDCQQRGGSRYFSGPSYEDGSRPETPQPDARSGSEVVKRGGFGRSGARYSAGG
ncbi:MAG: hypothetical protein R3F15_06545 [Lysobacterales bacterium]